MGNKVTGIIFAGGKSSRMGENKALVKYGRKRLIDKAIQIIYPISNYLLISTNEPLKRVPFTMVKDEYKGIGPIGGLYSVLNKSETIDNIVIACDVPLIQTDFMESLIEKGAGYDAVIPRLPNGKLEPLVAYYSKDILPVVKKHIVDENYKMVNLILDLNVKYIEMKDDSMFRNINTPEDLANR